MSGSADLLVVIPCLNEEAMLARLITSFAADLPEALIVVADGGSTDRSRAIVADLARTLPGLRLLDNPQRIQSAGINQAVAAYGAGRIWLLRIDAHADYPAGYAATLLAAAARTGATSVVVPMVSKGVGPFQQAAAAAQNSVLGTGGSPHRHVGTGRHVDHGHHALMRIDLFHQVGGYREDMAANEDAELDLRLAAAGGTIWLEPAAAITYYPRRSPLALWRQYRGYGRGRAWTLRLHGRRPALRQLLPLLPLGAVLLAPLALWHWWLLVPVGAWLGLCLLAGLVVGARAGGGWALLCGAPAAISHLAWACGFAQGILTPLEPAAGKPVSSAPR